MRARFVALLVLAAYSPAEAHDARPLSVEIVEETGYVYRVRIRIPPTVEFSNRPTIEWPAGCVPGADRTGVPIGFSSFGGVMMCAGRWRAGQSPSTILSSPRPCPPWCVFHLWTAPFAWPS